MRDPARKCSLPRQNLQLQSAQHQALGEGREVDGVRIRHEVKCLGTLSVWWMEDILPHFSEFQIAGQEAISPHPLFNVDRLQNEAVQDLCSLTKGSEPDNVQKVARG